MIGRRGVIVGTAVVAVAAGSAVAAERAGVLDDALRATGLEPVPQPDPGDERRVADVRAALLTVLAAAEAQDSPDVAALVREQLDVLGGAGTATPTPASGLDRALRDGATRAAEAAQAAVSPDLAQVLASVSAGLLQAGSTR